MTALAAFLGIHAQDNANATRVLVSNYGGTDALRRGIRLACMTFAGHCTWTWIGHGRKVVKGTL